MELLPRDTTLGGNASLTGKQMLKRNGNTAEFNFLRAGARQLCTCHGGAPSYMPAKGIVTRPASKTELKLGETTSHTIAEPHSLTLRLAATPERVYGRGAVSHLPSVHIGGAASFAGTPRTCRWHVAKRNFRLAEDLRRRRAYWFYGRYSPRGRIEVSG